MSQFKQFIESPKGRLTLKVAAKAASFVGTFVVAKAILGPPAPKPVSTLIINQIHHDVPAEPIVDAVKVKAAAKAGARKTAAAKQ